MASEASREALIAAVEQSDALCRNKIRKYEASNELQKYENSAQYNRTEKNNHTQELPGQLKTQNSSSNIN